MSFYNERGQRVLKILKNGILIYDDPEFLDFTGNVDVTPEDNGVEINVLGGGGSSNVIFGEVVAGNTNTFTLSHVPVGTIQLGANGQILNLGSDYTIVGAVITTIAPWSAGSVIASYQY